MMVLEFRDQCTKNYNKMNFRVNESSLMYIYTKCKMSFHSQFNE